MNVEAAFSVFTSVSSFPYLRRNFTPQKAMTMTLIHGVRSRSVVSSSGTRIHHLPLDTDGDINLDDSSSALALLAQITSSAERFADSLKMTTQEVKEAIEARRAESIALDERLSKLEDENRSILSAGEIGKMKHRMICRHRYEHMRKPFVCRECWTDLPICVCKLFRTDKLSNQSDTTVDDAEKGQKALLPKGVERVIVWTHHEEWGRTANTGSLLPLGLERTEMLMKGLDEHDAIMNEILNSDDWIPVVLWPGNGNDDKFQTLTLPDLRKRIGVVDEESRNTITNNTENSGRYVLISIEGTWNNARKMANKLPSTVLRLDLGDEVAENFASSTKNGGILFNPDYNSQLDPLSTTCLYPSLLSPLRRQGRSKHNRGKIENVSTLEATIVALLGLGLSNKAAGHILQVARTKVDRMLVYSGKYRSE